MKKIFTLFSMMVMLAFSSQAAYYLVGNEPFGNGWDPSSGVELTMNSDGTYSFTATINGSIWFVFADGLAEAGDWSTFNDNLRIGPTGGDETVPVGEWMTTQKSGGDHGAYKFTGSGGEYVVTYNPYINKFKIDGYVAPFVLTSCTVAGTPASIFGTEWDNTNTANDMTKLDDGTYELKKYGCELAAGEEIAFKVVGNYDWGNAWPNDNYVYPIEESGLYDLRFTFNPENYEVGLEVTPAGSFDPITGNLFILGEVNGNAWDPSIGLEMNADDEEGNIFSATFTTDGANIDANDGIGYSYFSFTTKLSDSAEDWGSIAGYRIGAIENDYLLSDDMMGIDIGLSNFGQSNSFKIPAGEYEVTVNLNNKTMVINKVEPVPEIYKIEKVWGIDDLSFLAVGDVRQGFGMDGKFYINDKANQKVIVVDENGLANTEYPGGANCGITRDEAGNLVISNAAFPDAWTAEATIKVVNPETNEMKEYVVPEECGILGRCDFVGFAKGNLMEDGVLYLTGGTNSGISILTIAGGEVSADECYAAPCDGLTPTTSTVINYFKDLAGEDALLYVTRNAAPVKITFDGEELVPAAISVPGKGACNGMFPLIWDGKEFFVYPTLPNYQNGFAVGEAGAEAPIVEVPTTVAANANAYQANWLNAEVDEFGVVTIYQYYPGGNIAVYRLTSANIPEPEQTEAPEITYEVTEDGVIITATGEGEVHLYVNGEEVENPYTIARGEEDVTVVVTATAKAEGKLISETTTLEVVVPAKEIEPESGYQIEEVWSINDLSFLTVGDVRQGFGMDGKFYINDKANQKVIVVDENGLTNTEYPGGANCGITRDEAGNLVISNAAFPGEWAEATIKVVNPETNEMKEFVVPEECGVLGRCDFIGFAKGNLMEDGVLYLTGATNTGVSVMTIAGGEVNTDECYVAACDGLTPSTSTVINYYTDLAGEESLLYVTRNAALAKLAFDGDDLAATTFTLPNKGACNGTFPFIWDEKEFFVYPTLPNYQNGLAVAEANAEAPIVEIASTVTANANAFTSNWLNAEVGEDEVLIYQYYPGGNMTIYRLTKNEGGVEEIINNTDKVVSSVRYYNIMGQEMKEANGITIVVTTYTDGTHSAIKVIK